MVETLTSVGDKTNLLYLTGCESHFTNLFCKIDIDLKFTSS